MQGNIIAQIYGHGQGGVGAAFRDLGSMITGVVTKFPLLTAAVAAAGVGIVGLRKEINDASDTVVSFGDVALAVWQLVRDRLVSVLKPAIDAIGTWFAEAWDAAVERVKTAGNVMINGTQAAVEGISAQIARD